MAVPSPYSFKAELRPALRASRRAFVGSLRPDERRHYEEGLAGALRPLIERADIVGGYIAQASEIDPALALLAAARVTFPTFAPGNPRFDYRAGPANDIGPHGIPQPAPAAPALAPDLILVPLLGVDPNGVRIGQGGGHYDRVLPALRKNGALAIGVGWTMQLLDFDIRPDSWDEPLDGFASPDGVRMFR